MFLMLFLVYGLSVHAHVLEAPPGYTPHAFKTPHQVIVTFPEAIDRGELYFLANH